MNDKKVIEHNNNQKDSSISNDNQPNFQVKIPDIQYATEGYEIDTTKLSKEAENNKTK